MGIPYIPQTVSKLSHSLPMAGVGEQRGGSSPLALAAY